MKIRSIPVLVLLFLVAFFSSMTGYILGAHGMKNRILTAKNNGIKVEQAEKTSPVSSEETPIIKEKEVHYSHSYILREHNGIIALYSQNQGEEKLWQTYDVSVSLLPEADRKQLKEGIVLSDISEALQIVEDYSG